MFAQWNYDTESAFMSRCETHVILTTKTHVYILDHHLNVRTCRLKVDTLLVSGVVDYTLVSGGWVIALELCRDDGTYEFRVVATTSPCQCSLSTIKHDMRVDDHRVYLYPKMTIDLFVWANHNSTIGAKLNAYSLVHRRITELTNDDIARLIALLSLELYRHSYKSYCVEDTTRSL